MENRWILARFAVLGLSLVLIASTPARNTGGTQKSSDQAEKKTGAEKKAADAKDKWIKAQENTKNKQTEVAQAKQEQEEARIAAREAQQASNKLKQPVPSSVTAGATQSSEQIKQDALAEKKAAEAKEKWAKA